MFHFEIFYIKFNFVKKKVSIELTLSYRLTKSQTFHENIRIDVSFH